MIVPEPFLSVAPIRAIRGLRTLVARRGNCKIPLTYYVQGAGGNALNDNFQCYASTAGGPVSGFQPARRLALAAFIGLVLMQVAASAPGAEMGSRDAEIRLGARLFSDERFSSPKGDLVTSCSHCHLYDTSVERARVFTDTFARSWVPWRSEDPRREGLRNAPTLFDVAGYSRLHFDGEFGSLEDLVRGTLAGRTFGWLPGEQAEAFGQVARVIANDAAEDAMPGESYRKLFKEAFAVELRVAGRDEIVTLVSKSIAAYVATLKSGRTSPYDQLVQLNGLSILSAGPRQGENPAAFAQRVLAALSDLERNKALQLPAGFGPGALQGMKIFFRTEGTTSVGDCVACHVPPLFDDTEFHNLGITQSEYDGIHGDGSFASLEIPDASAAVRPSPRFRESASPAKPGNVDLGYWNFVRLEPSPLRRPGESDNQLLRRMIATFKTPTLRNLTYSQPYMHNGNYPTLESALSEITRLSIMSRDGRVRAADEELARIQINQADAGPLVAFLNSLNDDLKRRPASPAP